jgi:hypothetical protein
MIVAEVLSESRVDCRGEKNVMGRRGCGLWANLVSAVLYLGFLSANAAAAQTGVKTVSIPALPMGWSSWNGFSNVSAHQKT